MTRMHGSDDLTGNIQDPELRDVLKLLKPTFLIQ